MPASAIDYESEYRAALRRTVQANARAQAIEDVLLHVLGGLLGITQQIQRELEALQRERRVQAAGHDMTHLLAHGNHD